MNGIQTFPIFVETVEHAKNEGIEALESRIGPARERFLSDPLSAWALHFLAANRMKRALSTVQEFKTETMDFVRAWGLVRPIVAIIQELKTADAQAEKMQKVQSRAEKTKQQINSAKAAFAQLTQSSLDNPSPACLEKLLGPETRLLDLMGESLCTELMTDFLTLKDPNVLIPLTPVVIATLRKADDKCRAYDGWMSQRAIIAKGRPRFTLLGFTFGNVVDQEQLQRIDLTLGNLRQSTPIITYCEMFKRSVIRALLRAHDLPVRSDCSTETLIEKWQQIAEKNAPLAGFTAAALRDIKGATHTTVFAPAASGTPSTDEPRAPLPTGGLLEERDIAQFRATHPSEP